MRRHTAWPAVAAALLTGIAGGFAFAKIAPALPQLKEELGLTLVQSGWLISTFNVLAAASAIFFGVFADRIGPQRSCIAGLALIIAGGVLGALSSGAPVLIASRLIEGLGFIAIIVAAPALIAVSTTAAQRNLAFGMWATYMPLGAAAVLALSSPLLPEWGWRGLWWLVAVCAAGAMALLFTQSRQYAAVAGGTRRSLASIRASLAQPVPWWLGLAFAMYAIQNQALLMWLPTYLVEERGVTQSTAALMTALSIGVNCIGNVFGGWLVQRDIRRGRIIAVVFCLNSLLFVLIFAAGLPDLARYALVVLYNIVCGPIPAAALSGGARYAKTPAEVGTLQGLIVQLTQAGIFLGPPVTAAAVSAAGSWDAALWVLLGASIIGLAAAFVIARHERRAPATIPK